ncbi:MAG: thioredoxin domain-containing protein [Alphaproteobacteria bacterium]|nr:thioredoxin domain-containing protein [Alphaproteobacteria bacterium]
MLHRISANLPDMTDKGNIDNRAAIFARNRLADATSPYLLQHKDNPVHWQPWGDAVFEEARRRNVPVLLSVGYAACHWCHVMAHESFEDDAVAALMNAHFVCIKLDREERPDLDEIYMSALSMMGEQGGWPLTMCLDADGAPFWGGTYFPKNPQYGRPGFMQILAEINRIWTETPDKIIANTKALTQSLRAKAAADARGDMPVDLPARAAQTLAEHVDMQKGGLAGAPKFPQPFLYRFLWQQAQLGGNGAMRDAVLVTARKICQGGIYDHLGGGFARYSVDADWLVPHFEKMLYDNALLIGWLCDLYRDTKDPLFAARIEETIGWLEREMVTREGAFAASLDADTEGEEGRFYVWDKAEIDAVLGDDAAAFCAAYDVSDNGNFEGKNIPNLLSHDDAPLPALGGARETLLKTRAARTAPGRDDKILADWNAMMIAALVEAARLFERPDWLRLAETAYDAARHALSNGSGQLCHAARDGKRLAVSLSADYAFMGQAAAALYAATAKPDYLRQAVADAAYLQAHFHDRTRGGYFANLADEETLLVNNKPVQDNAQPAANAAVLDLFAALATLTGDTAWHDKAEQGFSDLAGHLAQGYPSMTALLGTRLALDNALSIIIIGGAEEANALASAAFSHPIFCRHIIVLAPDSALDAAHPAHGKQMIDAKATAYICPGQSCRAPLTDAAALTAALDALLGARQTIGTP